MTDSEQVLPDVCTAPLNELARQAASIGLPLFLRKVPGPLRFDIRRDRPSAGEYVGRGILSANYENDALHIALADSDILPSGGYI